MRYCCIIIFFFTFNVLYGFDINQTHPRILLKYGEEKEINQLIDNDSCMASLHNYIIKTSDSFLCEKPLERIKIGRRLLSVSRNALKRIYYLSYSYRMTGEKKYAERAVKELVAVCSFSDWNPSHYLDVGEMVMAVAIGYDWLYDYIPSNIRVYIRSAIVEKAFKTAEIGEFYSMTNNWNQVCNAGLVLGALAIYEDEPELSKNIILKAIETVPLSMESYLPDGAYPEGYTYWGYGTGFQVTMLAAMESALSSDMGLSQQYAFMRSPYFMLFMTTPTGKCYNFSDSDELVKLNHAMYWFASKLNDISLLWYEYSYLKNLDSFLRNLYRNSDEVNQLLPNILVFSKNTDFKKIKEPKGNYWYSRGVKPVFVYRSGWNSKNDSYLGVVGGSASIPHGHMDAGSFIYESEGIRWVIDLGKQSYFPLENKGVDLWNTSQNGQRWNVFRLNNTSHSTITINNKKHSVTGKPVIVETYNEKDRKGAMLDLTTLYYDDIEKVIRSVYLDEKDDLIVSDYIETNDFPAEIMWVMAVSSDAEIINDNEIRLSRDGKSKILHMESPISKELKIWYNNPVYDYDYDNPGTLRVGFISKIEPRTKIKFKAKLY